MGFIPCVKCFSAIVRGLVRFPILHPSAKAPNGIRTVKGQRFQGYMLDTTLLKIIYTCVRTANQIKTAQIPLLFYQHENRLGLILKTLKQ